MHYYKRNIGDYHKKAGRLSILQHGAYTLLIDACYDRERFPTLEEAIDWAWAFSDEEKQAVEFVLRKFFTLEDGVYIQPRIMEEVDAYHENKKTNKRIAIEREEKRRAALNESSTKREQDVNEAPPNYKPLTTNHEPVTKNQNNPPKSPKGKTSAIEIKTYITECKAQGVKTIPPDDPVFEYATSVGIPEDFLRLAWLEFRDRMIDSGKRYKDWRAAFRKYVRSGYLKLWWVNADGKYELTTAGKQAEQQHRSKQ